MIASIFYGFTLNRYVVTSDTTLAGNWLLYCSLGTLAVTTFAFTAVLLSTACIKNNRGIVVTSQVRACVARAGGSCVYFGVGASGF